MRGSSGRGWWMGWAVAAIALTGCAELRDLDEVELKRPIDDNITKLINGRFTFERPEVGRMEWNGSACTGTLIRPNVVLTAAHCVGWSTNDGQGRPLGTFFIHKSEREVFQYAFDAHLAYDVAFEQGGSPSEDIALLRLIQKVPAAVATPTTISAAKPQAGAAVTLMGYGCGDRNNTGDANQGRKQKLPIQQGVSTNLCPGDSGGPTIIDADGTVFQVNSAYDGQGTDLFGDVVAMAATLNTQADAWAAVDAPEGQQPPQNQQPPQGGQLTCEGLFNCLIDCNGDVNCQQICGQQTPAEPRRRYDALVACSQANQCPDMACVELECPDQIAACFGGGQPEPQPDPNQPDPNQPDPNQPDPNAPNGQLSCLDLLDCGTRCAGDQACFDGCWAQATAQARASYSAYAQCAQDNNCQDAICAEANCGNEFAQCTGAPPPGNNPQPDPNQPDPNQPDPNQPPQGGNPPGQGGGLQCGDVLQCIEGCAWNDHQCRQNCFFMGGQEAQVRFNQLSSCAVAHFCSDRGCLQQFCPNELSMCVDGQGAPPAGQGPGGGWDDGGGCPNGGCPGGCPNGQGGCPGGCPNGQGGCPGGCPNGQGGCPGGCPNGQGGGDWGGCPNGAGGNWNNVADNAASCSEIINCFGGCGNDGRCQAACYGQGSDDSRARVDAIYDCAESVGCRDYVCVERACGAQLAACF